jgi:hypothetical protein
MIEDSAPVRDKDRRWWRKDIEKGDRWRYLLPLTRYIRSNQIWRKELNLRQMRLYGNASMVGFGLSSFTRPNTIGGSKVSFNVVKNISDTFTAMITKDEPKVSFVTEGGDWSLQEKAKLNEKFVEGQFFESKLYSLAPRVVLDGGGIFGTGVLKWYIKGQKENASIGVDRVFPWEMLVDEQEGLHPEATRNFYQERWVDRLVLETMYRSEPDKLKAIEDATRGTDAHSGIGYDNTADQLLVTEGWHIRAMDGATDGRHLMSIEGCDLVDEPWEYDAPPFVFYRKQHAPTGFWGISIADDLDGLQKELNALLMKIQRAMYLLGSPHVLIPQGSKINKHHVDNDIGSFWEFTGRPPTVYAPQFLVPPETYNHIDRIMSQAYELEGIPRPQAAGETPAETQKSGKSQEVYLQVANRRMGNAIKNYHDMFLECADWVLRLSREIVEKHNPKFGAKVQVNPKKGLRSVLFTDIELKENEYRLKRWPTNLLSDDPSSRIEEVEKLMNTGVLAPDAAQRLLHFPDIEEENALANASYNMVNDMISEMLEEGRYMQPPPNLNLEQAKVQTNQALVKAWRDGRPEDRLQLLRDFLEDLRTLPLGPDQPSMAQQQANAAGSTVSAPQPGVTPMMQGAPAAAPPGPQPPPAQAA